MLLPLVILNVKHVYLGLHTWVSLKGGATCIWFFGCNYAYAITTGYAEFKLSFGIIITLQLLTIIKKTRN